MFLNDETGDENRHLFIVDPVTHAIRDLTPLANISTALSLWSRDVPGDVAVGINDRDARWHDLYRIDLETGQRTLIWENTQELGDIGLDWQLRPRYARSNAPDGGSKYWRIEGTTLAPWRDVPYEDNLTTGVGHFDRNNERALLFTSIGRDTAACIWHDWATGHETLVAAHPKADCSQVVLNPTTFEVEAMSVAAARQEWIHVAPDIAADFALLQTRLAGFEFSVQSKTGDNRRWIVAAHKAEQPATYHLLDRDKQSVTELFRARPALAPYRLAPMHPVQGKSRDGLDLVSYLTLPADIEGDSAARTVADGACRPWRALGPRQLRLSRRPPVARRPRLCRALGQLSRLDRFRQSLRRRERETARGQDARRPHRHGRMGNRATASLSATRSQSSARSYGGLASFIGATFTPERILLQRAGRRHYQPADSA